MKFRITVIFLLLLAAFLLLAGRLLVVDDPQRANVIVVLAGETQYRPQKGVHLLDQGYGSKLVLDVPAHEQVFNTSVEEIARRWAAALPRSNDIVLCPIHGFSTRDEAREAAQCMAPFSSGSVLLVTSDFHSRRALSTFEKEFRDKQFSMAAAYDPVHFGMAWWRNREWAKTCFYEWLRLAWWEAVDRWRE
ncbi:MAG TPA: YdcF family protein [Terriglobales bacterium]|nr:YdcF family protein [Terriglobales bacterium]